MEDDSGLSIDSAPQQAQQQGQQQQVEGQAGQDVPLPLPQLKMGHIACALLAARRHIQLKSSGLCSHRQDQDMLFLTTLV